MIHNCFEALAEEVIGCSRCPRLVEFRENAPIRKSFEEQTYWRKPIPGFGDPEAWLLILGLAPSAQGANRTGRIFTGDESARFLIPALHKAELATQPTSEFRGDGLQMIGCYMTTAVKCVPPANKPLKEEFLNCRSYLERELALLKDLRAVLALGKLAFDAYQDFLGGRREAFAHGKKVIVPGKPVLYGSYHPSPQNTYTGKLTEQMFLDLLCEIKETWI